MLTFLLYAEGFLSSDNFFERKDIASFLLKVTVSSPTVKVVYNCTTSGASTIAEAVSLLCKASSADVPDVAWKQAFPLN